VAVREHWKRKGAAII